MSSPRSKAAAAAQRSGSPHWSTLNRARTLVKWAAEAVGGHVNILINNAGVALMGWPNAATEADLDETFAVDVKVPFFLVASLAPAMAERGWVPIVNTSTMVASFDKPAWLGMARAEQPLNS